MEEKKQEHIPFKRNIYEGVNIPVKLLNKAILALVILTAVVMLLLINNAQGLTVSYDTNGGSRIEDTTYMYGDLIKEPKEPVKEGYTFIGWYKDVNGLFIWDFENQAVESSMTLYAFWEEK